MHEFKDPSRRTRIAVVAVYIYMALELLYGLAIFYELQNPAALDSTPMLVIGLVAIVAFLSLIVTIVIVACWIFRASANAHALSNEMTISPGWAVGWYFVPIMNLFRPFQGMKETWMASHYRGNWHGEPTPGLLAWWWGLWLITNILNNISFRLSLQSPDGMITGPVALLEISVALLNIPLCLVLVAMMQRMCRAQLNARYDEAFA